MRKADAGQDPVSRQGVRMFHISPKRAMAAAALASSMAFVAPAVAYAETALCTATISYDSSYSDYASIVVDVYDAANPNGAPVWSGVPVRRNVPAVLTTGVDDSALPKSYIVRVRNDDGAFWGEQSNLTGYLTFESAEKVKETDGGAEVERLVSNAQLELAPRCLSRLTANVEYDDESLKTFASTKAYPKIQFAGVGDLAGVVEVGGTGADPARSFTAMLPRGSYQVSLKNDGTVLSGDYGKFTIANDNQAVTLSADKVATTIRVGMSVESSLTITALSNSGNPLYPVQFTIYDQLNRVELDKPDKTGIDGSVTVEGLHPGTYTVTAEPIDGYETPAPITVTMDAEGTVDKQVIYTRIGTGSEDDEKKQTVNDDSANKSTETSSIGNGSSTGSSTTTGGTTTGGTSSVIVPSGTVVGAVSPSGDKVAMSKTGDAVAFAAIASMVSGAGFLYRRKRRG